MTASQAGDRIEGFFDHLVTQRQPLLHNVRGRLRFDVLSDDQRYSWHLTIADGDVSVAREGMEADAIVRIREPLLAEIVSGRANVMAALLRGDIGVDGHGELLMQFQRTFPGPQMSRR